MLTPNKSYLGKHHNDYLYIFRRRGGLDDRRRNLRSVRRRVVVTLLLTPTQRAKICRKVGKA